MSGPTDSLKRSEPTAPAGRAAISASVHRILAALPAKHFPVSRRDVPPDGIYLLYEVGETFAIDGQELDRIVGVGTHSGEGRLARRLGIHASGDRRGSDLRLHLGGAIIAQANTADPRLRTWLSEKRTPMPEVEETISALIRERFTVRCIPAPDREERRELEPALTALLARNPVAPPSEGWLGRHAARREIRSSGLWNTQHFDAAQLTPAQLARIVTLAASPNESA